VKTKTLLIVLGLVVSSVAYGGGRFEQWVVDDNGTKQWYRYGILHREDGPAVERADGRKLWYLNGKLYRIDFLSGQRQWYKNGNSHREDGPAVEWIDGSKGWYLEGEAYTEEAHAAEMKKRESFVYEGKEKTILIMARNQQEALYVSDIEEKISDIYTVITQGELNTFFESEKIKDLFGCDDVSCYSEVIGAYGINLMVTIDILKKTVAWKLHDVSSGGWGLVIYKDEMKMDYSRHDRDGDGFTDDVDQCPDLPEDIDGDEDEDGCPEKPLIKRALDKINKFKKTKRNKTNNIKKHRRRILSVVKLVPCDFPWNELEGLLGRTETGPMRDGYSLDRRYNYHEIVITVLDGKVRKIANNKKDILTGCE